MTPAVPSAYYYERIQLFCNLFNIKNNVVPWASWNNCLHFTCSKFLKFHLVISTQLVLNRIRVKTEENGEQNVFFLHILIFLFLRSFDALRTWDSHTQRLNPATPTLSLVYFGPTVNLIIWLLGVLNHLNLHYIIFYLICYIETDTLKNKIIIYKIFDLLIHFLYSKRFFHIDKKRLHSFINNIIIQNICGQKAFQSPCNSKL